MVAKDITLAINQNTIVFVISHDWIALATVDVPTQLELFKSSTEKELRYQVTKKALPQ